MLLLNSNMNLIDKKTTVSLILTQNNFKNMPCCNLSWMKKNPTLDIQKQTKHLMIIGSQMNFHCAMVYYTYLENSPKKACALIG